MNAVMRTSETLLTSGQRDDAVDDFLALVAAVDGILQVQATMDTNYFAANNTGGLQP
jgi:hypothetical protein